MGPVTLLAHAADVDGLRSIEFRIDDAPVGEVAVGAERFGEAGFEWLPPGPGTYSLEVVALDAAGGRGTSARVKIIIADASQMSYGTPTPAPANVPSIVITGVTCDPGYTAKVDFEVSSPSGVASVEIYSTYTAAGRNERTYTAPYPLTVKDTLWLDEEDPDFLDRPHQVVVVAKLVGQPNEVAASAWEPGPNQRCPMHYFEDQTLAKITKVVCGDGQTVGVDFSVESGEGVMSVEVGASHKATNPSVLTYTAPYPLTAQGNLSFDEETPDPEDRPHLVWLKAMLVGKVWPVWYYAYEPGPNQHCPGHYSGDLPMVVTPSGGAWWVAKLNTNCRIGPGTAHDSRDVIESGAHALIDGKNAEGTWFRVLPPGSSRACWVSIASGVVQGDLSGVPVIAVAPIATTTATSSPANQPPVIQDFAASPGLILTDGTGCPTYSRTVTLSAVVSDDIGLDSVVAQWTLGSLSGETTLLPSGGANYSGAIGPVTQVGTMSINLIARDTSGASAQAGPLTVNVQNCIE
jgi:hypothetical protein